MARIDRGGHRRAEIDITQAKHEIGGVEHDAFHLVDRVEVVDATNELDI